ncbi:MAG: phosphoribosylaminoimidazolesuccinocarboxamide synthase [bacterium]|nr:phosphoribosylaminoimidazolesuccinocarboxamide synthase [bacterium]
MTTYKGGVICQTNFPFGQKTSGKVRDIYNLGDKLLIVTTDRISAFDVILPNGIPGKGKVLNLLSRYWFNSTLGIIKNHVIACDTNYFPRICQPYAGQLKGRSMLVRKIDPIKIEAVVRGYLVGSAWTEYQDTRNICGIRLPYGMNESDKLALPIFTPAAKSDQGHDENITFIEMRKRLGDNLAQKIRRVSFSLYNYAAEQAEKVGIIIADTKFEFGLDENHELVLIDEALTPDSSRFWPKDKYFPGGPQPSFDKQYVRDYLLSLKWDKTPPAPVLPAEVVLNRVIQNIAGLSIQFGYPEKMEFDISYSSDDGSKRF